MPNQIGPEYRGESGNSCQCRTKAALSTVEKPKITASAEQKGKRPTENRNFLLLFYSKSLPIVLPELESPSIIESRPLIASTAMFVFSAVMFAAGVTFFVVVMAAYRIRIVTEIALKQCVYIVICIA